MDLVTRLLLNTTQFDDNIRNSTKQVQSFQNVGQSITSTIGKFAGILGLGMGAMEAFNRTMEATQSTGDAFERITTQGSAAVDTFFNALSRGDFSSFLSGLQNAINKAGILADALDELQSKSLFNNAKIHKLEVRKQQYLDKAQDRTLSDTERNKNLKLATQTDKEINGTKGDLAGANIKAYRAGIRSLIAKGGYEGNISNAMIDWLIDNPDKVSEIATNYDKGRKVLEGAKASTITNKKGFVKANKDANKYETQSFGKMAKAFSELQETEIKKYTDLRATAEDQYASISSSEKEIHNTSAKINGSYKAQHKGTGKDSKPKEVIAAGSLDEVNKQLAEARKKYDAAATDALRKELFQLIQDLETKQVQINIRAKWGDIKDLKPEMAGLGDAAKDTDLSKFSKLPTNYSNPITKENIALNNDYADSLNAISNTLGAITNMTNEGASAWLNWGATLLSSIATAIPLIAGLTVAKKAEANANAEALVTGAGSSMAAIPLVGPLLAISAMASVIAALSNIPKFANGGLVYGNSIVNVGEYAGASSNPEVIAPLNKLKQLIKPEESNAALAGNVTFEIEGRKLVGVLSNYNKQQNRIK